MSEQPSSASDTGSADVLGDILGKILGSQIQGGNPTASQKEQPEQASTENIGAGVSGDIFSSLLSNPDLLMKLPSIISAAKPIIEMMSQPKQQASSETATVSAGSVLKPSQPSQPSHHASHLTDNRTALLCAMKPYLSDDRRRVIDYIVKLGRLGDILKTL
ncbi:MAG: hypothetical protein IKA62_01320 [Clostridia bacterium]|nr:hypothetical protein [Clostridia bacterium]